MDYFKDCDIVIQENRASFVLVKPENESKKQQENLVQRINENTQLEESILPLIYNSREMDDKMIEEIGRLIKITQGDFNDYEKFCFDPRFVDFIYWLFSYLDTDDHNPAIQATIILTNILFHYIDTSGFRSDKIIDFIFQYISIGNTFEMICIVNLILNYLSPETYKELISRGILDVLYSLLERYKSGEIPGNAGYLVRLIWQTLYVIFSFSDDSEKQFLMPALGFSKIQICAPNIEVRILSTKFLAQAITSPELLNVFLSDAEFLENAVFAGCLIVKQQFDYLYPIYFKMIENGYMDFVQFYETYDIALNSSRGLDIKTGLALKLIYQTILFNKQAFDNLNLISRVVDYAVYGHADTKSYACLVLLQYMTMHALEKDMELANQYFPVIFECIDSFDGYVLRECIKLIHILLTRNVEFLRIGSEYNIEEVFNEIDPDNLEDEEFVQIYYKIMEMVDPTVA